MKRLSIPYYLKLLFFGFAITTLPVVIIGLFSYAHSSSVVEKNVNAQKVLSLAQIQANVEQILKTVDYSATHFFSSSTIQYALNEPLNPRQFILFNQLKSELNYLQRMDTGISDVTMLSQAGNWLLNNNGIYRLDELQGPTFVEFMEHPSASFWVIRQNTGDSLTEKTNCGQEIQLVKKLPLTAFHPIGLAVITIPACSLGDNISLDTNHETLLLLDEKQNLIWAQGLVIQDMAVIQEKMAQFTDSQGQFPLLLDDQEYTITFQKSDFNGWAYLSAVPKAHLNKQSEGIGWFTLATCAALLLLFVFLSWIGSRRMYRPILSLYQDVLCQFGEPIKAKRVDELQVIGEQVHRLLRTQQELKDQLKGQMEQLKTFFMIKLVLGGINEEVVESMHQFHMDNDFKHFAVMSARIDLENTSFNPKEYDLLMFALNNMMADLLPEHKRMQPIVLSRTQITVITSEADQAEPFRRELFSIAEQVQKTLSQYFTVPIYIGISLTYQRLSEIPRAYEESVEALQSRGRFGEQTIIDFGDLGENHPLHYFYPYALQKELFNAIKLVDREQSKLLLHQLIGEICENNHPQDQQFNALRLFMNVMSLAHSYDIQPLLMSRQQDLFDELFQLDLPKDGEHWIFQMLIEPILCGMEERTEVRHLHISRELVHIIHHEFETDLSIEVCAERLQYNPSYLSTVFRKSMNVPFSTYLSQYRHQMAKKWLLETDLSVKVISERLRYNNPQNFIRSFRKLEGVPPGKYRELQAHSLQLIEGEG